MLSRKDIIDSWRRVLEDEIVKDSTFTFIDSDQDAPRPDKPYVTMKIVDGPTSQAGIDHMRHDDGDDKWHVEGIRTFTLSLQGHSSSAAGQEHKAADAFNKIMTLLDDSGIQEKLRSETQTLVVTNRGIVTNVTVPLDTGFEQRSLLEITFTAVDSQESSISSIESSEFSGTIDKGDGNTIEIGNFLVPVP